MKRVLIMLVSLLALGGVTSCRHAGKAISTAVRVANNSTEEDVYEGDARILYADFEFMMESLLIAMYDEDMEESRVFAEWFKSLSEKEQLQVRKWAKSITL